MPRCVAYCVSRSIFCNSISIGFNNCDQRSRNGPSGTATGIQDRYTGGTSNCFRRDDRFPYPRYRAPEMGRRAICHAWLLEDTINRRFAPRRQCGNCHWMERCREVQTERALLADIYDVQAMAMVNRDYLMYYWGYFSAYHWLALKDWSTMLTIIHHLETNPLQTSPHDGCWKRPWLCERSGPHRDDVHGLTYGKLDDTLRTFEQVFFDMSVNYARILGFVPYRRLGFAIWSWDRMKGFGFDIRDERSRFLWISVLDAHSRELLRADPELPRIYERSAKQPRRLRVTKNGKKIKHVNPVFEHHMALIDSLNEDM